MAAIGMMRMVLVRSALRTRHLQNAVTTGWGHHLIPDRGRTGMGGERPVKGRAVHAPMPRLANRLIYP